MLREIIWPFGRYTHSSILRPPRNPVSCKQAHVEADPYKVGINAALVSMPRFFKGKTTRAKNKTYPAAMVCHWGASVFHSGRSDATPDSLRAISMACAEDIPSCS
jgi:hypothetical protein